MDQSTLQKLEIGIDTGESGQQKRKRKEKKDGDSLKFMSENAADSVDEKPFRSRKKKPSDSEENGSVNDTGESENKKRKKKEKDGGSLKSLLEIAADSVDEKAHCSGKKKPAESEDKSTGIDTGESGKKKRKEKEKKDGDSLKIMSENAADSVDEMGFRSGKKKPADSEENGSVNDTGENETKKKKKKEKDGGSLKFLLEIAADSVDGDAHSSGKKKPAESEIGIDTGESGKKKRKEKEKKDGDSLKFMSENAADSVDEKPYRSGKKKPADSEENGSVNDTGESENKNRKKKEKDGGCLKSLLEIAEDSVDEKARSSGKKKPAESEDKSTSIDTGESGKKKMKEKEKKDGDSLKFISENAADSVDEKAFRSGKKKPADSEDNGCVNGTGESETKKRKKKEKDGGSLKSLSEIAADSVDEKAHSSGKKIPADSEDKSIVNGTSESEKKKGKNKEKKDGDSLKSLPKNVADSVDKKALGMGKKKSADSQDKATINDTSGSDKKKRKKTKPNNLNSLPKKAKKTNVDKADEEASSSSKRKSRRVSFSGDVEVFPPFDDSDVEMYDENNLIRGKRYTAEEDQLIRDAVYKYIEVNQLGEEGLQMVLKCSRYPQVKNCWKEICSALPWRPYDSVYGRAHTIFERSEKRGFTEEENETIRKYHGEFGPQWKKLSEVMGKQRMHIKDAWRRIRLPAVKNGYWSQDEYQGLFDLVNLDLRMKAFDGRKTNNVMIRENISWEAISGKLSTRTMSSCCHKWYDQLTSLLVREGLWADADDYLLLAALQKQDACNMEDVDWDSLLEKRSGEVCQRRWKEMARHIGGHRERTFLQQVDVLTKRYCEDMLQYREEKKGLQKDGEENNESE